MEAAGREVMVAVSFANGHALLAGRVGAASHELARKQILNVEP